MDRVEIDAYDWNRVFRSSTGQRLNPWQHTAQTRDPVTTLQVGWVVTLFCLTGLFFQRLRQVRPGPQSKPLGIARKQDLFNRQNAQPFCQ